MKQNIKNILFIISIVYSLVIVILMLITNNNLITSVELHDSKENKIKLEQYKERLGMLKQNDCTKVIGEIISHYEETSYDGVVNLKEMFDYDFDNSLLNYYQKVKEMCKISDEKQKEYDLPVKFITASIQRDELYLTYYFQYELHFKDYINRLIIEPQIHSVEYQINRAAELEIINILIEHSSKGDTNE